jgi:hypothetical protein
MQLNFGDISKSDEQLVILGGIVMFTWQNSGKQPLSFLNNYLIT